MGKRSISAKQLLEDIRAGMDDSALMDKYRLKPEALQTSYKKLLDAGVLKPSDLNDRKPSFEMSLEQVSKCPACGKPHAEKTAECPHCGVIISKFSRSKDDDLADDWEGGTGYRHFLSKHGVVLTMVVSVFFLVSISGLLYWMKAKSDKKKQAELVQLEKIERQKRLKEDAEARKRKEAILRQEELRLERENQRVEREIAKQVREGQLQWQRQEAEDRQRHLMEKTAQDRAAAEKAAREKVAEEKAAREKAAEESEQAHKQNKLRLGVLQAYSGMLSVVQDMSLSVLGKGVFEARRALQDRAGTFRDKLAELKTTRGVAPEVVEHFDRAFQYLLNALRSSSQDEVEHLLTMFMRASRQGIDAASAHRDSPSF